MFHWLRQPYPYLYERLSFRLTVSFSVILFVFVFLLVFKPFNIDKILTLSLPAGALAYGLTSGLTILLVGQLMVTFFPNYFCDKAWTIGRELLCTNIILLSISLSIAVLGIFIEECPPDVQGNQGVWQFFLQNCWHTYTVGLFPVTLLTTISYNRFLKKNLAQATQHNLRLESKTEPAPEPVEPDTLVTIASHNSNNDFSFKLQDLLFIMADGNYVEFHLEDGDSVTREIRRNTLSNIESQLVEYNFLFRSHRAYLVNLKKVIHSSGNAQGYELKLVKTDRTVPVSRRNLGRFDELISN